MVVVAKGPFSYGPQETEAGTRTLATVTVTRTVYSRYRYRARRKVATSLGTWKNAPLL